MSSETSSILDIWRSYLTEHGITSNPFALPWSDDRRRTRFWAAGVPEVGRQMSFEIDPAIKDNFREILGGEYSRMNRHQVPDVQVISSIPGGGKTRLLAELPDFANSGEPLGAAYFVTFDFHQRVRKGERGTLVDDHDAERAIALRIIHQALYLDSSKGFGHVGPFVDWYQEVIAERKLPQPGIVNAIRILGGDPTRKCLITVDEVNKVLDNELGYQPLVGLIRGLSQSMQSPYGIFCFLAGTHITDFISAANDSSYRHRITFLNGLSWPAQAAILDGYKRLDGWRLCSEAKENLLSLGGLPRLVEMFISGVHEEIKRCPDIMDISWEKVLNKVTRNSTYVWSSNSSGNNDPIKVAERLAEVILLQLPVKPNDTVLPHFPTTYDRMQQTSSIMLQEHPLVPNRVLATMPPFAFEELIGDICGKNPLTTRWAKLKKFMEGPKLPWEHSGRHFEKFICEHSAIINSFFGSLSAENTTGTSTTLKHRYAGGYGGAVSTEIEFLNNLSGAVHECKHHFPQTNTPIIDVKSKESHFDDGNCYINAPGAQFADSFYVCSDQNQKFKQRLLIAEQIKCYGPDQALSFNPKCINEHTKNKDTWNKHIAPGPMDPWRIITVVIATCNLKTKQGDSDCADWKDLLVIDHSKFKEYFGILDFVLSPRVTGRFAVNVANLPSLEKYFTPKIAKEIVKRRGTKGFLSKTDFEAEMHDAFPVEMEMEKYIYKVENCDL